MTLFYWLTHLIRTSIQDISLNHSQKYLFCVWNPFLVLLNSWFFVFILDFVWHICIYDRDIVGHNVYLSLYACIGSKMPRDVDGILSLISKLCGLLVMVPGRRNLINFLSWLLICIIYSFWLKVYAWAILIFFPHGKVILS